MTPVGDRGGVLRSILTPAGCWEQTSFRRGNPDSLFSVEFSKEEGSDAPAFDSFSTSCCSLFRFLRSSSCFSARLATARSRPLWICSFRTCRRRSSFRWIWKASASSSAVVNRLKEGGEWNELFEVIGYRDGGFWTYEYLGRKRDWVIRWYGRYFYLRCIQLEVAELLQQAPIAALQTVLLKEWLSVVEIPSSSKRKLMPMVKGSLRLIQTVPLLLIRLKRYMNDFQGCHKSSY
jgi:hypothetical protein